MTIKICRPTKYRNKRNGRIVNFDDYMVLKIMHKLAGVEFPKEDWEVIEEKCEEITP